MLIIYQNYYKFNDMVCVLHIIVANIVTITTMIVIITNLKRLSPLYEGRLWYGVKLHNHVYVFFLSSL